MDRVRSNIVITIVAAYIGACNPSALQRVPVATTPVEKSATHD